MLCAKFGWNWLSGSGEEDFLMSSIYFCYFVIISPWKRVGPFIWTNLNPSPKNALFQVWLKLAQWFWRRRIFNVVNIFLLFCNYLPLEKDRALHLNKLESPSTKNALCQVWLKFAHVVLEKIFLISSRYFHYFVIISPWKKSRALHLNKLEFPSPKGCFVPSLVEIGSVVLEKKIFNFVNVFLSTLGKGHGPSFEQSWIPFTQGCFVPSLVEIGPVVLEKKIF